MNRDQLTNADIHEVSASCIDALDKIQRHPRHVQVPVICALFLSVSEASGLTVQDLLQTTERMTSHADGRRPEFAAVIDYVKGELL